MGCEEKLTTKLWVLEHRKEGTVVEGSATENREDEGTVSAEVLYPEESLVGERSSLCLEAREMKRQRPSVPAGEEFRDKGAGSRAGNLQVPRVHRLPPISLSSSSGSPSRKHHQPPFPSR